MATFSDTDRPLILDNTLFDYLMKNDKKINFDDAKLKRLSSILSNIPYNMLKQSHDIYQRQVKLNEKLLNNQTETENHHGHHHNNHHHHQHNHSHSHSHHHHHHSKHTETTDESNFGIEKAKKQQSEAKRKQSPLNFGSSSNIIVIHVCDEAKQLKRDFTCPHDLLVKEMKYFSYNINLGANTGQQQAQESSSALAKRTLDDIEISVHCDINIFDWLMRYVKRNLVETTTEEGSKDGSMIASSTINDTNDDTLVETSNNESSTFHSSQQHIQMPTQQEPKLEITNCVSILISSDFLIMPDLVDKCIKYMIENLNQILQIPCNMNTINDKLLSKIAAFIKLQQLDDVIDKKDKFKAKLFMKKIEFLFDTNKYKQQYEETSEENSNEYQDNYLIDIQYNNNDDSITLFRCKICGHIMTQRQSQYIKCQLGILDKYGNYNYFHMSDEKFDINNFIIELKERLKTWQNVYWFLWALIKCCKCIVCKEWFRFVDFNKCAASENSECKVHNSINNSNTNATNTISGNTNPVSKRSIVNTTQSVTLTLSSSSSNTGGGNATSNSSLKHHDNCTCVYKDHVIDFTSFSTFYSNSTFSSNTTINRYLVDDLMKHKEIICYGNGIISAQNISATDGSISFCNLIENYFRKLLGDTSSSTSSAATATNATTINNNNNTNTTKSSTTTAQKSNSNQNLNEQQQQQQQQPQFSNFFIDSITGRHISFFNRYYLNLVSLSTNNTILNSMHSSSASSINDNATALASVNSLISSVNSLTSDVTTYLKSIPLLDPLNVFNSQDLLQFLKADAKKKWDHQKPARWNQDNQREDDMRRLREISNYIFKLRAIYDQAILSMTNTKNNVKTARNTNQSGGQGGNMISNMLSGITSSVEMPPGGYYYRIEHDWKQRVTTTTTSTAINSSSQPVYQSQISNTSGINSAFNTNNSVYSQNYSTLNSTNASSTSGMGSIAGGGTLSNNSNYSYSSARTITNLNNTNSSANSTTSGYNSNVNSGITNTNPSSSNNNNKLRQGAVATVNKFSNN